MRFKLLGLVLAFGFLSACSSFQQQGGNASGVGASSTFPANSMEYFVTNVGDRVYFDLDKSTITADAASVLNFQAAWLKANPQVTVRVEGHCDERGTREYNLALGERRANAVREYLISQGVDAARLSTISYGKERPVADGSNEAAWAQNRRGVTTLISGYGG